MRSTWRRCSRFRDRKLKDGVSNVTVNRALEVVRRILNVAHQDWRWLKGVPKIRMLKEPRRRVRFLRREEADRLIEALPERMNPIVELAFSTGCRAVVPARSWGLNGAAWISTGKWPGSITARPSRAGRMKILRDGAALCALGPRETLLRGRTHRAAAIKIRRRSATGRKRSENATLALRSVH
jgi:hypothetical protein